MATLGTKISFFMPPNIDTPLKISSQIISGIENFLKFRFIDSVFEIFMITPFLTNGIRHRSLSYKKEKIVACEGTVETLDPTNV